MPRDARVFPVGLLLTGQPCLVVGGGRIAARKASALLAAGAVVTAIAEDFGPVFDGLDVRRVKRRYRSGDLAGYRIVIAATGDRDSDAVIYSDGEAAGTFVNSADDPEFCSFYLPAVLRRGRVTISVSTDGVAPALSAWVRDRIAAAIDDDLKALAEVVAALRAEIRREGRRSTEDFDWREIIDSLSRTARAGGDREALLTQGRAAVADERARFDSAVQPGVGDADPS